MSASSTFEDLVMVLIAVVGLIMIFNSICIVVDSHLVPGRY
jgi:hypothetical protein